MTEHPHAQTMRAFFAAFGAADRAALEQLTAPGFVWRFPGRSPIRIPDGWDPEPGSQRAL